MFGRLEQDPLFSAFQFLPYGGSLKRCLSRPSNPRCLVGRIALLYVDRFVVSRRVLWVDSRLTLPSSFV